MNYKESKEQQALFTWAKLNENKIPQLKLMFHIPNGGKRNAREAARLKREGVKAGVPDIFLPVSQVNKINNMMSIYNGLFIEMKINKNKPTKNQKKWIDALTAYGYKVEICYSWIEAANIICDYLGIKRDAKEWDWEV